MSFPRYPKYKDSGVEWLGEVPEHWHVNRFKIAATVLLSNVDKKSYPHEVPVRLCNYTDVYKNERITAALSFMAASASQEQIERFSLHAGDTLLTKDSESQDDIAVAAFVPQDLPGVVCGYHLAIARPKNGVHGAFIKKLLDSHSVRAQASAFANGLTRFGLSSDSLQNLIVAIPTLNEQQTIIDFLDYETAKIEALIQVQQRLIELLKEKRQAVISHAVTKGIDPSVPMKDPGVESISQVPWHWRVTKLKYISTGISVGIVIEPSKYYCDSGVPALRSLNVRAGAITNIQDLVFISEQSNELLAKSKLRKGDLVSVRSGEPGATAVITEQFDGCNCIDLIIIRHPNGHNERFLEYFLNSDCAVRQFSEGSGGAMQKHFNIGEAKNIFVSLPPALEQTSIVECLNVATARFDNAILHCEHSTRLLRERRAALISAAVTGKIDVRNYTPRVTPISDELYQPA